MNRWLVLILLSAALALPVLPVHAELPVHADATGDLFEAAKGGTASEVKAALAAGADPGARKEAGWTPLHAAARNPNPSVIAALIEAGADPGARNEKGRTPLHVAAVWNVNPAVITALIEAGADPGARTEGGATPLHSAASIRVYDGDDGNLISGFGNPSAITALIEGGANPGARNEYGATPLHWAAFVLKRRNHSVERYNTNPSEVVAVIKALLEGGADPGAPDYDVKTPFDYVKDDEALKGTDAYRLLSGHAGATGDLFEAAKGGTADEVKAALAAGANPGARDDNGKTPFDYAKENEALKGTDAYWLLNEARFE